MEFRPIKTEEDYEAAKQRIWALMDAQPNTPEENELEVLAILVDAYERKHFPIEKPRLEPAGR
jgi:HTH-type transcriptional regulator/antitoxin HigA